jgi:hypothetical protein
MMVNRSTKLRSRRSPLVGPAVAVFVAIVTSASLSKANFRLEHVSACKYTSNQPANGPRPILEVPGNNAEWLSCPVSTNSHFPFNTVTGIFVDGSDRSVTLGTSAAACVTFQNANGSACGPVAFTGSVFAGVFDMRVDASAWYSNPNDLPFISLSLADYNQFVYGWFLLDF